MKFTKFFVFSLLAVSLILAACQPAAPAAPAEPAAPAAPTAPAAPAAPAAPVATEAAATEAPAEEAAAPEDGAKSGGILRIAVPNVVHLDVNGVNQFGLNEIAQYFYETLFDRKPTGVEGLLVTEETISADGLVHTWKLQPNVTFHDGTPFNGEVVKWNFDRKFEKKLPGWDIIPFDKVVVVDDLTVEFHLTRPYPPLQATLAVKTWSMYNPGFTEARGEDEIKSEANGTGPFMVEEFLPNDRLILTRNPNYWQEGLPYLDGVEYLIVPDGNARATMVEAGDVEIASFLSFLDISRLSQVPGLKEWAGTSSRNYYISLTNLHPPLDNVNVRRAINYAVDKEGVAAVAFAGYVSIARSHLLTEAVDGYAPQTPYEFNPDKARELLDQEGWLVGADGIREKDGEKMEIGLRTRKGITEGDIETAETVQAMLADVGIRVVIDITDTATFLADMNKPYGEAVKYDMANLSWGTFSGDAEGTINNAYTCVSWPGNLYNYAHYCNEEVDAIYAQARSAITLEERNKYLAEMQRIVWEEASNLFLFESKSATISQDNVMGLYLDMANTTWQGKYSWLDQ